MSKSNIRTQIHSRLLLSEYIGSKVKLKRHNEEYIGLCPFHNEKTPSFSVNDKKGVYYCFGCHAQGDAVTFAMEYEKLPYTEAIKYFVNRLGIKLEPLSKQQIQEQTSIEALYNLMTEATEWFHKNLFSYDGKEALDYLESRGFDTDIIKKFSLGFAPKNESALKSYMIQQGYTAKQLYDTGLIINEHTRFTERIMVPVYNVAGKVIGFGGRSYGNHSNGPKYINSPETVLFKKGHIVFAENHARAAMFKKSSAIVTEGYFDVIAMHKFGFTNTIATMGTAITAEQLERLWYYTDEPIICMDGDLAGRKSASKVAFTAIPLIKDSKSLRFVFLPKDHDPDSLLKEYGNNAMKKLINHPTELYEFLWQMALDDIKPRTPERRAKLEKYLQDTTLKIKDSMLAKTYGQFFRQKLYELDKSSFSKYNKKLAKASSSEVTILGNSETSEATYLHFVMIKIITQYPNILADDRFFNDFLALEFETDKLDKIREVIVEWYTEKESIVSSKTTVSSLLEYATSKNVDFSDILQSVNNVSSLDEGNIKKLWQIYIDKLALANMLKQLSSEDKKIDNMWIERHHSLREEIAKLQAEISSKTVELFSTDYV